MQPFKCRVYIRVRVGAGGGSNMKYCVICSRRARAPVGGSTELCATLFVNKLLREHYQVSIAALFKRIGAEVLDNMMYCTHSRQASWIGV